MTEASTTSIAPATMRVLSVLQSMTRHTKALKAQLIAPLAMKN